MPSFACGHASPRVVALTMLLGGKRKGFGGAKRLGPAVSSPKRMFRNWSTPMLEMPSYETLVLLLVTEGFAAAAWPARKAVTSSSSIMLKQCLLSSCDAENVVFEKGFDIF